MQSKNTSSTTRHQTCSAGRPPGQKRSCKTLDELPDLSHRVQSSSQSAQASKESPAEAEAPAGSTAHDSPSSSY